MTLTREKPNSSVLLLFNIPRVYWFTFKISSSLGQWYHSVTIVGIHKQMPRFLFLWLFCKPFLAVSCQSEIWHSPLSLLSPAENEREGFKNLLEDILKFLSIICLFVCLFVEQSLVSIWVICGAHQPFNPGLSLVELNSASTTFSYLPDSQREAIAGMI